MERILTVVETLDLLSEVLSDQDLAFLIGTHQTTISRWRRRERVPLPQHEQLIHRVASIVAKIQAAGIQVEKEVVEEKLKEDEGCLTTERPNG